MKRDIWIKETDLYLYIPIQPNNEKKQILFHIEGEIVTELNIPIGSVNNHTYEFSYHAKIPVASYANKCITIEGEVPEDFLNSILLCELDNDEDKKHYQIHFAARYGWINDPNGLVFYDNTYHLYYQYNPFDTIWDNMSWGHAVSKDLLHWQQKDTVMFPDEDGMIFSGCGLMNDQNLLQLPQDAIIYFYTAAGNSNGISKGKEFVQKIAYSLDGGDTLIKLNKVAIPTVEKENRDPKVFWHERTQAYIMCLWLKDNEFGIFRSSDIENWDLSQRFILDQGFECPDLFELSIDDAEKRWVFWSADGFYYIGDFDGYSFVTDGIRREAYKTKLPYAAQTFSNINNKIISIPWLRTKQNNKLYCGVMGLPRELTLARRNGELHLRQIPVFTLEQNQDLIYSLQSDRVEGNWTTIEVNDEIAIKLDSIIRKAENDIVKWNLFGTRIIYNVQTGVLEVEAESINIGSEIYDFSIIYDLGIVEITADCGIIYAVFDTEPIINNRSVNVNTDMFDELKVYRIN